MSGGMTPLVLDRVLTLATNNAARLAYAAGNDRRLVVYQCWWERYPTGTAIEVYDRLTQTLVGYPIKTGWVLLPDYYIGRGYSMNNTLVGLVDERAQYWQGRIKWLQSLGLLKPQPRSPSVDR